MPKQPDLALSIETDWNAALVNKKRGSRDSRTAALLKDSGYQLPAHWKRTTARQFVGWDGEGITYPHNVGQSYVLFGASTGDRIAKPSLGTVDCFNLILAVEATHPDAIHCGFAFQYDCNMMFRDLSRAHLERIYRTNKCRWNGYSIEYRPGKWVSIRKGGTSARIFDVWGFFQSSFVVACERYLGSDDAELIRIREGKQARQSFTYDQLDAFIVPYWEAELRMLVRLMDSLRDDFDAAGLQLHSWHGPGAVANTVFRTRNIHNVKADIPKEINRAAQYAYAGGRFELFQCGHHPATVYEYDINSAYPAAIARLPNLQRGHWKRVDRFQPDSFALWRVRYTDGNAMGRSAFLAPQPLFYRDKHGAVSFPSHVEGWYWTPEAALIDERCIIDGWLFDHDGDEPFAFVRDMYETRLEWKSQQNSAEKALKLALNSLYGKMAQRTGWMQEGDAIPRWHQLEWAGYVTSTTRATLFSAILIKPSTVIAAETDALFTTAPLPLDVGKELGQWSEEQFDWITYLQSGMYYAGRDGKITEKYRGFDKGSLPYQQVAEHLSAYGFDSNARLIGQTTRFIGLGLGLHTKAPWRSWQTDERNVEIGGGGKRRHIRELCTACRRTQSFMDGLHPLTITTAGGRSQPHVLPWLTSQEPELRRQDELARW